MEPAIQVSPVKEEDMSFVRKVFEDMANNVVAATHLSAQVQKMQRNVDTLSGTVEKLMTDVTYYSDQAHAFRRKSEELQGELANVQFARDEANARLDRVERDAVKLTSDLGHANAHIATITKDRDDAQIRVMELEDQNKTLSEKLNEIARLFNPLVPSEPVHLPQFVEPRPEPIETDPSVRLPQTPEPAPSKEIDSRDLAFDWARNTRWDSERGAYVYS